MLYVQVLLVPVLQAASLVHDDASWMDCCLPQVSVCNRINAHLSSHTTVVDPLVVTVQWQWRPCVISFCSVRPHWWRQVCPLLSRGFVKYSFSENITIKNSFSELSHSFNYFCCLIWSYSLVSTMASPSERTSGIGTTNQYQFESGYETARLNIQAMAVTAATTPLKHFY